MHERALCTVHATPPTCPIVYTLFQQLLIRICQNVCSKPAFINRWKVDPSSHRLGGNPLLVNETTLGVFRQLMAPGAWIVTGLRILCYIKKIFIKCLRSRCYIIQKIFSKKYFLYPPKIRSAIENINYFHIRGNFLATYALYIVTHALLAYSPQRLKRYYGVRHRVVSINNREMSPVVLKMIII